MTTIGPIDVGHLGPGKPLKKGSQGGIGKGTLMVFVGRFNQFCFRILAVLCKFQDVVFSYFRGKACPH